MSPPALKPVDKGVFLDFIRRQEAWWVAYCSPTGTGHPSPPAVAEEISDAKSLYERILSTRSLGRLGASYSARDLKGQGWDIIELGAVLSLYSTLGALLDTCFTLEASSPEWKAFAEQFEKFDGCVALLRERGEQSVVMMLLELHDVLWQAREAEAQVFLGEVAEVREKLGRFRLSHWGARGDGFSPEKTLLIKVLCCLEGKEGGRGLNEVGAASGPWLVTPEVCFQQGMPSRVAVAVTHTAAGVGSGRKAQVAVAEAARDDFTLVGDSGREHERLVVDVAWEAANVDVYSVLVKKRTVPGLPYAATEVSLEWGLERGVRDDAEPAEIAARIVQCSRGWPQVTVRAIDKWYCTEMRAVDSGARQVGGAVIILAVAGHTIGQLDLSPGALRAELKEVLAHEVRGVQASLGDERVKIRRLASVGLAMVEARRLKASGTTARVVDLSLSGLLSYVLPQVYVEPDALDKLAMVIGSFGTTSSTVGILNRVRDAVALAKTATPYTVADEDLNTIVNGEAYLAISAEAEEAVARVGAQEKSVLKGVVCASRVEGSGGPIEEESMVEAQENAARPVTLATVNRHLEGAGGDGASLRTCLDGLVEKGWCVSVPWVGYRFRSLREYLQARNLARGIGE